MLIGYNLNFLSNNVNELNSTKKKELKCLNTLERKSQIMEHYSYRKLIPQMTLSSTGMTILKVNCFFHMEPQIHAVSWLDI